MTEFWHEKWPHEDGGGDRGHNIKMNLTVTLGKMAELCVSSIQP